MGYDAWLCGAIHIFKGIEFYKLSQNIYDIFYVAIRLNLLTIFSELSKNRRYLPV